MLEWEEVYKPKLAKVIFCVQVRKMTKQGCLALLGSCLEC